MRHARHTRRKMVRRNVMKLLPGLDYNEPDVLVIQGFEGAATVTSSSERVDNKNSLLSSEASNVMGHKAQVCKTVVDGGWVRRRGYTTVRRRPFVKFCKIIYLP